MVSPGWKWTSSINPAMRPSCSTVACSKISTDLRKMTFSIVVRFFSVDTLNPRHHKLGSFLEHRFLRINVLLNLLPEILKSSQADFPECGRLEPDVILF